MEQHLLHLCDQNMLLLTGLTGTHKWWPKWHQAVFIVVRRCCCWRGWLRPPPPVMLEGEFVGAGKHERTSPFVCLSVSSSSSFFCFSLIAGPIFASTRSKLLRVGSRIAAAAAVRCVLGGGRGRDRRRRGPLGCQTSIASRGQNQYWMYGELGNKPIR